jgi:thiol:disulfide interchange protein
VALSHSSGKPIFIDFTGVTCTNCRWMEKNIFPAPGVLRELGNFVRVQLYTDRPTDADRANQALEQRLSGTAALPTYVLLGADGSVISKFEGATRDAGEFTSFLKKASPAG